MNGKISFQNHIPRLDIQHYKRYLPTAFDESLSILQKVNMVINFLHEYTDITNLMLDKWNEVIEWLLNEGLEKAITDKLQEWYDNGKLELILENLLLSEYARKDWSIAEQYNLGTTVFYREGN